MLNVELAGEDMQLIAAMLGMMKRHVSPAAAEHLARKFLMRPLTLEPYDVKVICAGLGALAREIKKDTVLVRQQREYIASECGKVINKLERRN